MKRGIQRVRSKGDATKIGRGEKEDLKQMRQRVEEEEGEEDWEKKKIIGNLKKNKMTETMRKIYYILIKIKLYVIYNNRV